MELQNADPLETHLRGVLDPDEQIHVRARARDGAIAVSDRRLIVVDRERLALNIPFERLRRLEFDVERDYATLVVVPEQPTDEPQVLPIPREEYRAIADALVAIGLKL
jgi:hypothetical protein